MRLLKLFVLSIAITITACAIKPANQQENWPSTIPPKRYFTEYYAKDIPHQQVLSEEDYLMWVKRFYLGWTLYRYGWVNTSRDFASTLPTKKEQLIAQQLVAKLGKLVAPEWAKNEKYRVINTRHLTIWGNTLNESMVKQEQLEIIQLILRDVNDLLNKKIAPKIITADRYYPEDEFASDYDF